MNTKAKRNTDIIVVGGGASGLMAAGRAAECGAHVLLLEKMDGCGKKILVSGKTRCNLTNTADLNRFISMYGDNGRFLFNVFHKFFRPELLDFLSGLGMATKVERGGRIFPVSDNAQDVLRAFQKYLALNKVQIKIHTKVTDLIIKDHSVVGVKTQDGDYHCKSVILATGGATWPSTGSTGDGYKMSAAMGHSVVKLKPALVPLMVYEQKLVQSMQGVSLRNVRVTAFQGEAHSVDSRLTPDCVYGRGEEKKPRYPVIESRFGEMLFTHFGLGGPVILLLSLAVVDALERGPVSMLIDLKPALSEWQLHQRLQKDLDRFSKRKLSGILKAYLPSKW